MFTEIPRELEVTYHQKKQRRWAETRSRGFTEKQGFMEKLDDGGLYICARVRFDQPLRSQVHCGIQLLERNATGDY